MRINYTACRARGWMAAGSVWRGENILLTSGFEPLTFQSVASRYTYYAILASTVLLTAQKFAYFAWDEDSLTH